jgi:hypothetical protein
MRGGIVVVLVGFWLFIQPGMARSFRCGNDLIQEGDRRIQVLKSCGEPDSRDSWEEVRPVTYSLYGHYWSSYEKVVVEEWTYNLGPQSFIRIVRFENGEVVEIETGDYGF